MLDHQIMLHLWVKVRKGWTNNVAHLRTWLRLRPNDVAAAQVEPALILHVRPYQESSAIVQMLTLGQGRVTGVLRGYRSKNGQVALQPFSVGTSCTERPSHDPEFSHHNRSARGCLVRRFLC